MKKILLPGIVAGIVNLILGFAISLLFMLIPVVAADYHPPLMRTWQDPAMSLFIVYPFVLGICLAWVWNRSKALFKGSIWQRATGFGGTYFLAATIPGMLITYSSFPLSFLTIIGWSVSGLVCATAAGLVFAKMNK